MGAWGGGSYLKTVAKNLETARVAWMPQPERTRIGDIWARSLHEIYFQRMSAADALKKAEHRDRQGAEGSRNQAVAAPCTVTTRTKRRHWRQETFLPYLLLAPALVLLVGMVYPFGLGLYYSFTSYWLQYPNRFRFIWFDNYINLLSEPLFARALEFTLGFTLAAVVVQVGLGLAVALFLHARIPGRSGDPRADAAAADDAAGDHRADVEDHDGIDQRRHPELHAVVSSASIRSTGSAPREGAVVSILIIDTWGNLPFVALILLGALQALPTEPYEAARVDGAGPVAMLRYVTLPLLSPFIVLVVTLPDDGLAADLRRDLRHDAGRTERRDHQPAHHGVPVFLPVVPDGQGHGAGHRAAPAGGLASYLLMRLWNRAAESTAHDDRPRPCLQRAAVTSATVLRERAHVAVAVAAVVLLVWTVFPFVWILLTSLKSPGDMLSVPPKFVFTPTFDNYAALVIGEQRGTVLLRRARTFRCSS